MSGLGYSLQGKENRDQKFLVPGAQGVEFRLFVMMRVFSSAKVTIQDSRRKECGISPPCTVQTALCTSIPPGLCGFHPSTTWRLYAPLPTRSHRRKHPSLHHSQATSERQAAIRSPRRCTVAPASLSRLSPSRTRARPSSSTQCAILRTILARRRSVTGTRQLRVSPFQRLEARAQAARWSRLPTVIEVEWSGSRVWSLGLSWCPLDPSQHCS
jgi:hypothetical protein